MGLITANMYKRTLRLNSLKSEVIKGHYQGCNGEDVRCSILMHNDSGIRLLCSKFFQVFERTLSILVTNGIFVYTRAAYVVVLPGSSPRSCCSTRNVNFYFSQSICYWDYHGHCIGFIGLISGGIYNGLVFPLLPLIRS